MSYMSNGGPAFPRNHATRSYKDGDERVMISETHEAGLSMRDYFAAAALQGLLACNDLYSAADTATAAYQYADAMLAARATA